MSETKEFEVVSPLRHDGKDYAPGKKVKLTDEQAAAAGSTVKAPGEKDKK